MVRLLEEIKTYLAASDSGRRQSPVLAPASPIDDGEITRAEAQLGFELPILLKTIYLEVGNGRFGPAEGFLPIRTGKAAKGMDLVKVYLACSQRPGWPAHLLPIVYCGCDVYFCVDCSHSKNRVLLFDGDLAGLEESDVSEPRKKWPYPESSLGICFRMRAKSLVEFLKMWLADETQLFRWV